jgi:D-alanyl-D-alanine carboxypeptidase
MRLLVSLTATLLAGCGGGGGGDSAGPIPAASNYTPFAFGSCPPPAAPPPSPAGSVAAIVDGMVVKEMQSQNLVGMTVGFAKQGKLVYSQAYGYADLNGCVPMQSDSPFEIGSITKTFTAAAILQLQSTGALDLDQPVITYLPDYPFDPRMTVRMLLNQISGLADYINDLAAFPQNGTWQAQGVAEQTVLMAIAQAPLQFPPGAAPVPGSAYRYSNSNYFVLGSIVEALSSASYPDYLETNIIGPLGLLHTSYMRPLTGAVPYVISPTEAPFPAPIFPVSFGFAAGALWSDVQDLATFDAALFNGQILPAAQFAEMVTPPLTPPGTQYAMGWARQTQLNRPFVSHNGGTYGSNAYNGLFLDNGFSISLLMNARPSTDISAFANQVIQAVCTSSATTC